MRLVSTGKIVHGDFTQALTDFHKARLINLGDNLTRELDTHRLIKEYIEAVNPEHNDNLLQHAKIWIARNHIHACLLDGINTQTFIDAHVDFELHSMNIPKIENYELVRQI